MSEQQQQIAQAPRPWTSNLAPFIRATDVLQEAERGHAYLGVRRAAIISELREVVIHAIAEGRVDDPQRCAEAALAIDGKGFFAPEWAS